MNKLEQNALRIAELLGYVIIPEVTYTNTYEHSGLRFTEYEIRHLYSSYDGLMPLVFECNYEQDDLDIEIVIYGSGLDVHLDDEDILITTYDTKEGFIKAIQLAVIKYLELKNG